MKVMRRSEESDEHADACAPPTPAEKCGMWKDITGEELLFQTRLQQLSHAGLGHGAGRGVSSTQTLASWRKDPLTDMGKERGKEGG